MMALLLVRDSGVSFAKLDCTNTMSMNVASWLQEAVQEETAMVHALDEVLQYVDSERFTNMR